MPAIINFNSAPMPRIIFFRNFFLLNFIEKPLFLFGIFDTKLCIKGIVCKRKSMVLPFLAYYFGENKNVAKKDLV